MPVKKAGKDKHLFDYYKIFWNSNLCFHFRGVYSFLQSFFSVG